MAALSWSRAAVMVDCLRCHLRNVSRSRTRNGNDGRGRASRSLLSGADFLRFGPHAGDPGGDGQGHTAATPAATSLTSPPSQERTVAPRAESPARDHNDEVDGDDDDDECQECGDVLELEDGEDDDERVGASGSGLGGLLLVGAVIAASAWLVKKVTEPPGIPVVDPTGQCPASMRAAPSPSGAPAGYHFETTAAGETVLVRDGYTLA